VGEKICDRFENNQIDKGLKGGEVREMRFLRIIDSINEHVGRVAAYIGAVMMLLVTFEVVMRYLFDRPTSWTFELNQSLLCIYAALAGGYTLLHQGHVNVEIVSQRFRKRTQAIVNIFTSLLFFGFIIVLLWETSEMAFDSLVLRERSEGLLGFPLYPAKIAIVIGIILILLQGFANFIMTIVTLITGVEPPKAAGIFEGVRK
jgi:TRAP-type mannitol/chloroaromatic compound transport system permease small subunit